MKNNKSRLLYFVLLIFMTFTPCFAKSYIDSRIGVLSESLGNISELDAMLLNGAVKDKIESNLKKYTELTIVSTNIPELKAIQKGTQETGIDKNTAVRMGKLMAADCFMNATIRKANSGFSIAIKVIDLTTGEVLASVQEKASDSDSIWAGNGCAIDLLTIELCEALGIDLTASQKYILRYGEKDLSTEEQLKLFKSDCDRYQKLIEEYNKELSLLNYSTDLDAKEKQIALQAQKEIAEQKLASSLAAQQRLEELKKIRLEEEKKEAERTEEQKKKRQEIEALAQKKVNEIRNEKKNKTTTIEEIAYIENEKRIYVEIRDSVNDRVDEIEQEKELELRKAKEEINSRPYRKAHLDAEGNPIPEALELRREEYAEKAAEIRAAKTKEIDAVKKSVSSNMSELISIIDSDTAKLAKTKRKASSVTDEISVVMGLYDGSKRAWIAHLFYTVDGRDLYQQELTLSYETVTGKKIKSIMDSDYLDTVDLYDSLFSRGTPVIIFELDYTVEAMPKDRPSIYKFNFETLTLKDSRQNLKVIEKQSLDRYKLLHITPACDIRTEEELYIVAKNEEKKQKKVAVNNALKTKMIAFERKSLNVDMEFTMLTAYAGEIGVSMGYDYPLAGPLFIGGKFGFYESSEFFDDSKRRKKSEYEDSGIMFNVHIGLNLPLADDLIDFYVKAGVGVCAQYMYHSGFLYTGSVGFELSVFQVEYSIDVFPDQNYCNRVSVGISTRGI